MIRLYIYLGNPRKDSVICSTTLTYTSLSCYSSGASSSGTSDAPSAASILASWMNPLAADFPNASTASPLRSVRLGPPAKTRGQLTPLKSGHSDSDLRRSGLFRIHLHILDLFVICCPENDPFEVTCTKMSGKCLLLLLFRYISLARCHTDHSQSLCQSNEEPL